MGNRFVLAVEDLVFTYIEDHSMWIKQGNNDVHLSQGQMDELIKFWAPALIKEEEDEGG